MKMLNAHQAVQAHLDNASEIKRLQAENKALANAIQTEMDIRDVTFIVGTDDDHGLKRVETVRWTLDTKAAKEELGEDWVIANSKQALVTSLRLARD
jgi:hypothetical protein